MLQCKHNVRTRVCACASVLFLSSFPSNGETSAHHHLKAWILHNIFLCRALIAALAGNVKTFLHLHSCVRWGWDDSRGRWPEQIKIQDEHGEEDVLEIWLLHQRLGCKMSMVEMVFEAAYQNDKRMLHMLANLRTIWMFHPPVWIKARQSYMHRCKRGWASPCFTFPSSFLFLLPNANAPRRSSRYSCSFNASFSHSLSAARPQCTVTALKTLSSYFWVSCVSCGGSLS